MITSVTNDNCFELRGMSTDKKPVNKKDNVAILDTEIISKIYIGNGSIYFEIDKSEVYMFNEDSNHWVKL